MRRRRVVSLESARISAPLLIYIERMDHGYRPVAIEY